MKKLLLFGLVLGLAFGAYSQNAHKSKKNFAKNNTERRTDFSFNKTGTEFQPRAIQMKSTDGALTVERIEMGKSANVYSVLTSYQRSMAYDEASNTILGTFRGDPATYPDALGSGTIMSFTSSDMGDTWDWQIIVNPDPNVHALRYPSGVIFNPDGATSVEDAYVVAAGPSHTGGTWDFTFYGAAQLNNSNFSDFYYPWENENDWARSSMTVVPGAVYNFGQDYTTVGELGVDQTIKQHVGTTDDPSLGFDWEINTVTPDWLIDEEDGHAVALYTSWSAWSRDGSIGYAWMVGVSNDSYDYGVYQPQVFYTTDGGDSWDEIELNLEDHPVLVEFLPPWEDANGDRQTVRPSFLTADRTYPGVVDNMGRLHLFSNVFGSSRGDVLNPDNGYWIAGDVTGGHIFDFVMDETGIQQVYFVDSVMTAEAPDNSFGDVTWDHRLQVSKSLDETKIFALWTDGAVDDEAVTSPNIKAWGVDVSNPGMVFGTDPINFTEDDLFAGFFFYPYLAEHTPMVDGNYNLLVSTSLTPTEFSANDPLAPVTHNFVKGITFAPIDFVNLLDPIGIDDNFAIQSTTAIEVSQNQPNPFTGTTTIEINSRTVAPVLVEVTNIMGQTVYTMNAGTINGTKRVPLDASNLDAGVYFYTVTIGNERVSKKMIVE
jgi:hypothetical protein